MSNSELYHQFKEYLVPYSEIETQSFPQRIIKSLKEVAPDKIFKFNDKPIILYFKESKQLTKDKIFRKYWNFSESPIIFVETDTDIEIYNGFGYTLDNGKPTPLELNADNLNYYSLISGEYFRSDAFEYSNKKLDTTLLQNIEDARRELLINLSSFSLREKLIKIKSIKRKEDRKKVFNSFTMIEDEEYTNLQHIANALLGRVIFIRYLVDRKIALYYNGKKQAITNDDLKDILSSKKITYQFFRDLQSRDKGFNGDWFPINSDEENIIKDEHLQVLKELISGTEIKSGQMSLFDYYDFSIIPIEFISNIYEQFIGEEKQKEDGAYYTPTFLVDYVLKYTVDEYFKNNPNEYNCKILDPACGSGIFLVEAFRKLVAQYEKIKGKPTQEILKQLVKDNIFGIDYNKNALDISIFSLYLAMLDYQEPKDIENFKFPYLIRDNPNFFNSDFFDREASYNEILKKKKIDFIIGNPPYGRSTIKSNSFADIYIKEEKLFIGNNDIVQPFMIRVKDFSNDDTKVSFIVTSKVFYNLQTNKFREQFLSQFKIKHILELSSVRHQIFKNADTPVSIIFYNYSTKEEVLKNTIRYISMKPSPYFEKLKLLLISKGDLKKVSQAKLLEYDYLWKILVYGSYLDFNFIRRLKDKPFSRINEQIEPPKQGLIVGGGDKNPTIEYIGMPYIASKQFKPFYIEPNSQIWEKEFAHRNKSLELFKAPALLIVKGINKTLDLKTGIMQKDSIFADSITTVKSDNENILYGIMGIFYSSFFKYFILNTGSSIGVEREQIHNPEKFSLPYIYSEEIIQATKNIEKYSKDTFAQYNKEFDNLRIVLNQNVLNAFSLTEQEYALVDYAVNIVKPWVMEKKYNIAFAQYDYKDSRIEEYVNIFVKHYTKLYEPNNLYFQATIHWSKYAIGIYFKVLNEKPKSSVVWEKEENIENFLKLMQGKSLENLFIQKDIKGFESHGFYVVKPNEIKNWHKAIGYLDFYEFKKAILRAGKNKWKS